MMILKVVNVKITESFNDSCVHCDAIIKKVEKVRGSSEYFVDVASSKMRDNLPVKGYMARISKDEIYKLMEICNVSREDELVNQEVSLVGYGINTTVGPQDDNLSKLLSIDNVNPATTYIESQEASASCEDIRS